nr:hypothetical protein [uncultured Sphaerochaeta sp.]
MLEQSNKVGQTPLPGYEDYRIEDGEVVKELTFTNPRQEEVDIHATDFLYASLDLWATTKRWGLPNGEIGWGKERATVIQIINILESECNRYDSWKLEQNSPGNKE